MMERVIYKICERSAWDTALKNGAFTGSADDVRDGFIHFSTARQLRGTLDKHFAGRNDLVLIEVDTHALTAEVRWESSSGGTLYPHLYGPLPTAAAIRSFPLVIGTDGRHSLPEGLDAC